MGIASILAFVGAFAAGRSKPQGNEDVVETRAAARIARMTLENANLKAQIDFWKRRYAESLDHVSALRQQIQGQMALQQHHQALQGQPSQLGLLGLLEQLGQQGQEPSFLGGSRNVLLDWTHCVPGRSHYFRPRP